MRMSAMLMMIGSAGAHRKTSSPGIASHTR
jgi:hypothetical protein